jgi:hypothetical protein
MNAELYQKDFYDWIQTTINQLKNKDFASVDWENLIEELDALGRKEKAELRNRLTVLLEHLLKLKYWQVERERNERGWRLTIKEQQIQIRRNLKDSPSLKSRLTQLCSEAYEDALAITTEKTGLQNLPNDNPFSEKEILD